MMIRYSLCSLAILGLAQAQFQLEWATQGGDAQRSSWVRTDPKISAETLAKPGFEFLWKMKFANIARQGNGLMAPVLMNRLIGYRGFRALAFVGGSADKIFVIDSDLARTEWENSLSKAAAPAGTPECPGGMTTAAARGTSVAFPGGGAPGGGGGGRSTAASSAVGEPGQGSVTLAQYEKRIAELQAARSGAPVPGAAKPGGFQGRRGDGPVYVVSGDGQLHFLNVHNGADVQPPVQFLPPGASAVGLIALERAVYAATTADCGEAKSGVYRFDLASKTTATWMAKSPVVGSAGMAFGGDGSLFVATKGGQIVHLDVELKEIGSYSAHAQEFTTSPVVFEHGGKTMLAAATKSGQLHVVDGSTMQRLNEPATFTASTGGAAGALASWQDSSGMRWVLVPSAKGIVAFKVLPDKIESGWSSREIAGAMTPMVVNGIVFTASTGKSAPGMLWALDGKTGRELWNSGKTITSPIVGGGFAGAVGQIYVPAYDGTLYAFGFPIEH